MTSGYVDTDVQNRCKKRDAELLNLSTQDNVIVNDDIMNFKKVPQISWF